MPRVILIDDDPSLLDVLTLAFEDDGYYVSASTAGADGVRLVTDERPDVLVCDINMPDVDGFTLCRKLRDAGETLPILLLTSRDNEVDEALGL